MYNAKTSQLEQPPSAWYSSRIQID